MAVLSVLTFEVGDDLSWSDVLPVCPPVGISRYCCCSDLESEGGKNNLVVQLSNLLSVNTVMQFSR